MQLLKIFAFFCSEKRIKWKKSCKEREINKTHLNLFFFLAKKFPPRGGAEQEEEGRKKGPTIVRGVYSPGLRVSRSGDLAANGQTRRARSSIGNKSTASEAEVEAAAKEAKFPSTLFESRLVNPSTSFFGFQVLKYFFAWRRLPVILLAISVH